MTIDEGHSSNQEPSTFASRYLRCAYIDSSMQSIKGIFQLQQNRGFVIAQYTDTSSQNLRGYESIWTSLYSRYRCAVSEIQNSLFLLTGLAKTPHSIGNYSKYWQKQPTSIMPPHSSSRKCLPRPCFSLTTQDVLQWVQRKKYINICEDCPVTISKQPVDEPFDGTVFPPHNTLSLKPNALLSMNPSKRRNFSPC